MATFNKHQSFLDIGKIMERYQYPLDPLSSLQYMEEVTTFFQSIHDRGYELGFQAAVDSEEILKNLPDGN